MAKKVRAIPATLNRFNSEPVAEVRKRRVAGYARVSTDHEEQATSYEAQMSYYKNYIESREDWEFVGMYSDEGISATNTKHRDGFNQMIEDALARKIDLIITKSVSRFARNTVDSLSNVRKLREKGVEIYFEKENIWTLDAKGELMITIMSSLAQEESRSISENTTWGKRKQFADGKGSVGFKCFLGYDKDFKINLEQANTVKLIYKLFVSGLSFYAITKELGERNIKAPAGGDKWHISTVRSILTNEKYRGDALLQKEYTADFLEKTRKKNHGEIPQYYVEEHHEAIIPPEQFDFVQAEIARRDKDGKYSGVSIFSNKIKCGCCGGWYGSKVWHSRDKYRKVIYRCNRKYGKGIEPCSSPHFTEDQIKEIFLKALNTLIGEKDEAIANLLELIDTVCDTGSLALERDGIEQELIMMAEHIENLIRENARVAQDQEEYAKKEEKLRILYGEKHSRFEELESAIQEKNDTREILMNFIKSLQGLDGEQTEFREELWGGLVDHIRAENEKTVTVVFRGGIEITV
jgi:site-specific DNA recombinase